VIKTSYAFTPRLLFGDVEKKAIIALQVEKYGFRIPFRLKPDFIPRRGKSARSVVDKSVLVRRRRGGIHHQPIYSSLLPQKP
jgi:hypothetical protein